MTDLHITNGKGAAGEPLDVSIVDGSTSHISRPSPSVDAQGLTVAPGFIDIQVNGAYGHDFTENPASMWDVGIRLPEQGVTSFCPTIITSPPGRVAAAQDAIANRPTGYKGAEPLGLHVEGPYLSEARHGTHPIELLVATAPQHFDTTNVAIVTIAPEVVGASSFIESLVSDGVVVSLGHSAAIAREAKLALDSGASLGTHLFNAMEPMTVREPGLAGVLLTDQRAYFGVIADGVHLAPEMLQIAWRLGRDRLILITDAISATGMPEGTYDIGGIPVTASNGAVRNIEGSLAGSVLTMDRAVAVLMETTAATLDEAIGAATRNPAAALQRSDLGTLAVGSRGDVVLLDRGEVVITIVGGEVVFCSQPDRLRGVPNVTSV
jgi:N-acetylglucosamine-6-phosphate deacetylase